MCLQFDEAFSSGDGYRFQCSIEEMEEDDDHDANIVEIASSVDSGVSSQPPSARKRRNRLSTSCMDVSR